MNVLRTTSLDGWIRAQIGVAPGAPLSREAVRAYQWQRLQRTLAHVRTAGAYYRSTFAGRPAVSTWGEFELLPFTTAADIAADPLEFLCISQAEVARVVTLRSSGTSGPPKRIYFDPDDLERTIDFFHHGMSTLVQPGQRVLILLPGGLPGSVGDLLVEGLGRMGAEGVVFGPVQEPEAALDEIASVRPHGIVGIPVQVLALARHPGCDRIPPGTIRSILLSTDYVPEAIVAELRQVFGCAVFQHYGMTEMGYGGGVTCDAHDGYHLREADLYVEVIDPDTGRVQPDGRLGEVVFTTLSRNAMPLVRYRTGDVARVIPGPCPCGSGLRRLGKVIGRVDGAVNIGSEVLRLADLDETVFRIPGVLNFQAALAPGKEATCLRTTIHCDPSRFAETTRRVEAVLAGMPALRSAVAAGRLRIAPVAVSPANWFTTGAAKRTLIAAGKEGTTG